MLIDAGLSCAETQRRLQAIQADLSTIRAVCVSHEHDDHKASLGVLQRRHAVELYANSGTIQGLEESDRFQGLKWNVFSNGSPFQVGDLQVEAFSVPHDSYDPVGFAVSCGAVRVGLVTDMGMPTELIRQRLRHCHVVIVEANHDERLLRDAARPWSLKQRISGRQGHLSNAQAAQLVRDVAGPLLRTVFLAHLSAECNRPDLALRSVREALQQGGHSAVDVKVTYPDRVSELVVVEG